MKIAISGKGGVGKTTFSALLAKEAVARGYKVLAVDADPNSNLASTLGISADITPIAELKGLIEERLGSLEGFFRLNPKVDDIPERFSVYKDDIRLIVMGGIVRGGGGCACPENNFLRSLLSHILLQRDELVIVDMEAGIEHLGRATAQGVDALLVVVEPDKRSLETAARIKKLAEDIGLKRIFAVGNKIHQASELEYISRNLPQKLTLVGSIAYSDKLRLAGKEGALPQDDKIQQEIAAIFKKIESIIT